MVGRVVDPAALPGGAALIAKAVRKASLRWFLWCTVGTLTKPVKTVAASESPDGKAVFEDGTFRRVHVKGVHPDGRAFVVRYVEAKADQWSSDAAYVLRRNHVATADDGEVIEWRTERPTFDAVTVSDLKHYTKDGGDDDRE
jgi:hypothetical protein